MPVGIALVCCVVGALIFSWRLFVARRLQSSRLAVSVSDVSIVVPARNEAHNLPTLLASLKALSPAPREIIVVDDHSTDGTGEVAARYGVKVLVPGPLPPGFVGKTWACAEGARAATGTYLLFTDADTRHAPSSLGQALAALRDGKFALLSVLPSHRIEAWWEHFQGVFQLLLVLATSAGAHHQSQRGGRRFAIGQYLLFERGVYEALGGHACVAGRLAEDLAFARAVAEHGEGVGVLFAPGLFEVRMYPEGFSAFVAGWRRNFRDGIGSAGPMAVCEIALVMQYLLGVPLWGIAAVFHGHLVIVALWLCVYCATAAAIGREQLHYGRFSRWSALGYPWFTLVFVGVSVISLIDSWRGANVKWRGRTIEPTR